MTYLCIDIEATCWAEDDPYKGDMEMIEIAAVHVNEAGEVLNHFTSFVQPEFSNISDYCEELLNLDKVELDKAPNLYSAMEDLADWVNNIPEKPKKWFSWGKWDEKQIRRDCKRKRIDNPLKDIPHCNAKSVFQKQQLKNKRQVGLLKALELMGMQFEGQHHRALDDTRNLAKLLPFYTRFDPKINVDGTNRF